MLKTNLILIIVFIIFVVVFLFFSEKNKNEKILSTQDQTEIPVTANEYSQEKLHQPQIQPNEKDDSKPPALNLDNFLLQNILAPQKNSDDESKESIEEKSEPLKKRIFKTAEEVLDTHFPYLEKELGVGAREKYKVSLPMGQMTHLKTFTEEQHQEYLRLRKLEQKELKVITNSDIITKEEFEPLMTTRGLVKAYYIPQLFNILTEEQQIEFAKYLKENFFENVKKYYNK